MDEKIVTTTDDLSTELAILRQTVNNLKRILGNATIQAQNAEDSLRRVSQHAL